MEGGGALIQADKYMKVCVCVCAWVFVRLALFACVCVCVFASGGQFA